MVGVNDTVTLALVPIEAAPLLITIAALELVSVLLVLHVRL